jgi:uncharacterized membrane protein
MNDERTGEAHHRHLLDRVIFLSDGVFAISITLLVLDLRLPELPELSSETLRDALLSNSSHFISFVISFYVIGIFWLAHLRMFSLIDRYTRGLALLNLLFLMSIAIMPFSTKLVGEYGSVTLAAVLYSLSLVFTSVTSNLLWLYAARRRKLLRADVPRVEVVVASMRAVVTTAFFILATGLAFISVGLASAVWISIALATRIAERIARRRASR